MQKHLAKARTTRLLKIWEGLGYWKRAIALRESAKKIENDYHKRFPKDVQELEKLPGVGHYTARAVACFAFNNKEAFLDTNIRRVYLHFFFSQRRNVSDTKILRLAQKSVWQKNPREWHYALMDYGAVALGRQKHLNRQSRNYHRQNKFEGSFRLFRTKTLRFLLAHPTQKMPHKKLFSFLQQELKKSGSPWKAQEIIASLQKDSLLCKERKKFFIP